MCLYKPGGHPPSFAILCLISLTVVSARMEVGFPVQPGDFLCRTNLCGKVGEVRNEVLSGRSGGLGASGGSPSQSFWWVAGKSHLVISNMQRPTDAGD